VARAVQLRGLSHVDSRPESLLGLAWLAFVRRDPLRAEEYIARLLEDPGELRQRALAFLSVVRADLRRFPSARRILDEATDLSEEPVDRVLIARAHLHRALGEREEGIGVLAEAIERFPESPEVRAALADALSLDGDLEGAIESLREGIRYAPELFRLQVFLGELCSAAERWDEAAEAYERALRASPKADAAGFAMLQLAQAHERRGDRSSALALYRVVGARPRDPVAPWAAEVARRIESAPAGARRVVVPGIGRAVQKHNHCGPSAFAAVLARWGDDVSQDRVGEAICETTGTPPYRFPRYARELGYEVRCFRGRPGALRELVAAGFPVVIEVFVGECGHYLVVVGFDELHRTVLLRDPASLGLREMDEAALEGLWRPVGWRSVLVAPPSESDRLARHAFEGSEAMEGFFEAQRHLVEDCPSEARQRFEPLVRDENLGAAAPSLFADILVALGEWDEAIRVLEEAARRFPDATLVRFRLVQALAAVGRTDEAMETCEELLALAPRHGAALHLRGRLAFGKGDVDRAVRDLRRAVRLDPSAGYRYAVLGEAIERSGDDEGALANYDAAIDIDPEDAWTYAQRGELLSRRADRLEDAEASFRRALEIRPEYPWALAHLGQILHEKLDRIEEAEELYRRSIELEPRNAWTHAQLGALLFQGERIEEATEAFGRAVEILPDYPYALARLGQIHHERLNRPDEAETLYRRALELEPAWAWPWTQLGLLLRDVRARREEARECFERARDLEPENPWPWAELAWTIVDDLTQAEEAERCFRRVLEFVPDDLAVQFHFAALLMRLDRDEEAVPLLERLVECEPEDPTVRFHLALALDQTRRRERALAAWERFLELVAIAGIEESAAEHVRLARKRVRALRKTKRGWWPFGQVR
jgi:tetratricopeptide (TPR) repeat protein